MNRGYSSYSPLFNQVWTCAPQRTYAAKGCIYVIMAWQQFGLLSTIKLDDEVSLFSSLVVFISSILCSDSSELIFQHAHIPFLILHKNTPFKMNLDFCFPVLKLHYFQEKQEFYFMKKSVFIYLGNFTFNFWKFRSECFRISGKMRKMFLGYPQIYIFKFFTIIIVQGDQYLLLCQLPL